MAKTEQEFLNLDEVAAPKRSVTIKGVKYDVEEMTVENFIETTRASKRDIGDDQTAQMEEYIGLISRYIPSCPVEVLRGLNFTKLAVLLNFVNGKLENDAASEAPAGEGEGSAKK